MRFRQPYQQELNDFTDVFKFGAYKGSTVDDVLSSDPKYILWLNAKEICKIKTEIVDAAIEYSFANKIDDIFLEKFTDIGDL